MNFLGVGPFELLLILVIATIVLGPERMAQAGRTLGRLYAQYRLRWQKDVDEMTRELRRELAMLQQEMEEIRQTAESEIKSAQAVLESVADTVDSEIKGTQAALEGVVEPESGSEAEEDLFPAADEGGLAQPDTDAVPGGGDVVEPPAGAEGSTPAEVDSSEEAS